MPKKTNKKTNKKTDKKASKKAVGQTGRAAAKTAAKKPAAKTRKAVTEKASKTTPLKPASKSPLKKPKAALQKPPARTASEAKVAAKADTKANLPISPKAALADGAGLAEGSKAPAFRLPRDGGQTLSLADYAGQKLVLFFYPRADTPGCTKEAIDFTRLAGSFAETRTSVVGVSADPLKAQESFRTKHNLGIPLVSDEKHEMLEAYGVWGEKSMYGKTFHGVLRTTVLIGANGRIVRIWRHVKVDGHADEVLEATKAA